MDCKVIPSECVVTQHKLLVLTCVFRYASDEIEARKSREQSDGRSNETFLRCLRIELL
jgi:hypothetical protein